jgi:hypothetical protein
VDCSIVIASSKSPKLASREVPDMGEIVTGVSGG